MLAPGGAPVSRGKPPCGRCGHARASHKPYFPGGDKPGYCAAADGGWTCSCWQYQPQRPLARLLAWLRKRPEPVQAEVLRPGPVRFPVPGFGDYEDDGRTRLDISRARPYAAVPRPRGESL